MAGFFSRLFGSGRAEPPRRDLDPHEAAAALLVEAALADGIYANLESDMIAEILVTSFDLPADRADALLERGEELAENATDTHSLTRHVKRLSEIERTRIIEGLYRVSLADGEACKFEEAFIRHVASLLHVDDFNRVAARKRAEAAQG
jgi:uncharacterized tellurite resistance protein B-like protein